ncbi:SusD/RagB family nutrient-binding outer membrane lipoprotein [Aurantibacter sp.]|uniref:SusD/RagB family nutrient-binding outer membrane lipoprotein n=1 Tax=Aurantibacter sp. TaxID=2807103 RepID=UPI0035C83821
MKKYISKILVAAVIGLSFSSCENALDINNTEVDATSENITPDLLLAGAIVTPRPTFEVTINELGNIMMNHWAGDVNNVTGGFQDEFRLNITQNFYTGAFNGLFRNSGTYQVIISSDKPGFSNHKAIARILKSYYLQYAVDLYGDVPYSQALQFGEFLTPAYDDQKDIYMGLITDVNTALETMATSTDVVGAEDVIFNGDMSMWTQFANTLKLKMLLRVKDFADSNVDADFTTFYNTEVANLDENFLSSDATIDPVYENAAGKQNPFFANYGQDSAGEDTFDNDFIVPSDYSAEFLKGNTTEDGTTTGIFDARLLRLYEPVTQGPDAGNVTGVQQGADNTTAPVELSELGPGVLLGSEQVSYLMTAAEALFIQSEAAFLGVISGDAQTLFEDGIRASFNNLGIAGSADAYITASANTNLLGWTGSADKVEAIMTQKWIALSPYNAIESWIEYTRTGFPDVPVSIIAESPTRPNRLLYPSSEYSTNSANVPTQAQSDAFGTKLFWDVN